MAARLRPAATPAGVLTTVSAMTVPVRLLPPASVRRWAAVALAGAAGAAFALAMAARGGAPFAIDLAVRDLVGAYGHPPVGRAAAGLTLLGTGPVLYPVLLVRCVARCAAAGGRTVREFAPVLALAAGQVLELALFAPLHRPAPSPEPSALLATTYSSGRTAAAVLGWGLIVWQAGRRCRSGGQGHLAPTTARPVWTVALAFGTVVAATRVLLGVHWVTDALAGLATGSVLLAVALAVLRAVDATTVATAGAPTVPTCAAATPHPTPTVPTPTVPTPAVPATATSASRHGSPPDTGSGRWRAWLRGSPWAWSVPAVAALVPVVPILLAQPGERLKDMLVYHGAGGTAGAGENLYAFQTVFAMPFTYPPFAALVLQPAARMPLGLAQALWTAATLAAVVALAATLLRPVADRIGLPLTVAALLVSSPVRSHLRFGQVGVFLVLLVALDLLRRTHHRRGAGAGLGLATAIKLTPAVFLPWLAVTCQWRRLTATLLWCGGATVLGLALLWPSSVDYLFRAARDTGRFGANDIPGNQSVRGMLLRTLPEATADRAWLVAALVLVVVGTWQAWRCERHGDRLAAVGVLAALSVAVSPISWVHHLVFLAVPVAALASATRFRLVVAWFAVLLISFPFLGDRLGAMAPWTGPLAELVTDLPGLTAVAAVLLLPALVGVPPRARAAGRSLAGGAPRGA